MKWLVRSDFGLKCNEMVSLVWNYRSGVTVMKYLGWSDLYELISMNDLGRTSWYEKTLGMKWLMVWSDTKNEVDIVWSVWVPINESFVFISEWVVYADSWYISVIMNVGNEWLLLSYKLKDWRIYILDDSDQNLKICDAILTDKNEID